jgi:DNA modification methylase
VTVRILIGDVRDKLAELPDDSVHCVVTSPPYFGLRDYGTAGQIGLEPTLAEYIETMTAVFREVRRVLRSDGVCWLNIGDSYAASSTGSDTTMSTLGGGKLTQTVAGVRPSKLGNGMKAKDLMMVPARLALALQADGWWLRSDIIWHKPNPMPESVTDRPTNAHEHIFLLTKSARYWYDADAVREQPAGYDRKGGSAAWTAESGHTNGVGSSTFHQMNPNGANLRNVWTIPTHGFPGAHFATFPPELVRTCVKAGTSEKGCCSMCGTPWGRMVEIGEADKETTRGRQAWTAVTGQRDSAGGLPSRPRSTVDWQPGCACTADVMPCTVLDPFGGSGTTGLVADQLNRNAILVELNPEYAAMAENRIRGAAPMFAEVTS